MGSDQWTVVSEEKNGKRITLRRPDPVGADADHRDRRRGKRKGGHDPSATLRINVSCPYGRTGNGSGEHGRDQESSGSLGGLGTSAAGAESGV